MIIGCKDVFPMPTAKRFTTRACMNVYFCAKVNIRLKGENNRQMHSPAGAIYMPDRLLEHFWRRLPGRF